MSRYLKSDEFWLAVLLFGAIGRSLALSLISGLHEKSVYEIGIQEMAISLTLGITVLLALPFVTFAAYHFLSDTSVILTSPKTLIAPLPLHQPLCLQRFIAFFNCMVAISECAVAMFRQNGAGVAIFTVIAAMAGMVCLLINEYLVIPWLASLSGIVKKQ